MTLSWRDRAGAETDLDDRDGDFYVIAGPVGLDAPPPVNTVEDFIGFDGGLLANRRRAVRQIVLPFLVTHATRVQTAVAALARLLQGPGELVFADGTHTRFLSNVIYEGGLGGDLSEFAFDSDRVVVASLLALDPWWHGETITTPLPATTPTGFDAAVAFDAVLPFDGGTSASISVEGDTSAFPTITVQGPATSVTIGSGGLEWETADALSSTDVLVVDSRPGSRGPRLNGGTVDWSLLIPASRMWELSEGVNSVIVGVVGASGDTEITLEYSPRFLTP